MAQPTTTPRMNALEEDGGGPKLATESVKGSVFKPDTTGEVLQAMQTGLPSFTNNTVISSGNILLTPGVWIIGYNINVYLARFANANFVLEMGMSPNISNSIHVMERLNTDAPGYEPFNTSFTQIVTIVSNTNYSSYTKNLSGVTLTCNLDGHPDFSGIGEGGVQVWARKLSVD